MLNLQQQPQSSVVNYNLIWPENNVQHNMMGWENKDLIDQIVDSGQLIEKTYTYESDF